MGDNIHITHSNIATIWLRKPKTDSTFPLTIFRSQNDLTDYAMLMQTDANFTKSLFAFYTIVITRFSHEGSEDVGTIISFAHVHFKW